MFNKTLEIESDHFSSLTFVNTTDLVNSVFSAPWS